MEQQVIFLDTVHEILEQRLTELGFTCVDGSEWPLEETKVKLEDAFGIVIRSRFPMDEALLAGAGQLQFIARSGAGMENIDEAYCRNRGIVLFNAPEGNRNAVGEHALGMLLSLMNKLHTSHQEIRTGKWIRDGNRGVELDGKTVGIIGYGNNGRAFAKKLRGFDVKVLAYDKYKSGFGDDFVMEATLEALLSKADVISFHIPQNTETIYFANQEFFDALGKPIFLLNLSRGKIVETTALIRAIESGKVVGAGLDVNEFEKSSFEAFFDDDASIPDNLKYLLHSDKVLMTPHIGGWTNESYFKLSNVLADKISDWWVERQP
ncbi:MAG TPA: NAD(P)-dependent oxidoreductase [Fluviicola sp.]|nr:NAD(P)-dependent oxidoreductase [Fluviicola sp.]